MLRTNESRERCVRSKEQLAWLQFRKLDVRDQMNALDWMALGNSCRMRSSAVAYSPGHAPQSAG